MNDDLILFLVCLSYTPGLSSGPLVFLESNLITEIAEESFRPMVEVLSRGPGVVILSGESRDVLGKC